MSLKMIIGVSFLLFLLTVLCFYIKNVYNRFSKQGIPCAPSIPLIGSLWRSALLRINVSDEVLKIYREVGDDQCRYVGLYQLTSPIVLLKDLDLIKKVAVKDFDHFTDHRPIGNSDDEMFALNIFILKGKNWHDMRSTMSPAFTSFKLKIMYNLMTECGTQMTNYITECCGTSDRIELETMDLICRHLIDTIALTAYGLQVNSFKNKENEFYRMARRLTSFGKWFPLTFLLNVWLPKVGKFLKRRLYTEDIYAFYKGLVLDTMAHREKDNVVRADLIHLLMDAKKKFTDDYLVIEAMGFLLASMESLSSNISYTLYEIGTHPDVQRKLHHEIDESINLHGRTFAYSYENMKKMKYLDMVISEGLRKWAIGFTDRVCGKDYNLGPYKPGETASHTMRKGDLLFIPMYSLHRDPKYWEDPEKFDPERFSDENKHKINPFSYMPFGAGPRNCLAVRFSLNTMKSFLINLLADFDIKPSPRTPPKAELGPNTLSMKPKDDFYFYFVRRNKKNI